MNNYRLSKGVTERYTSFEEAAKAMGCKLVRKQTKDKNKLEKQREEFCKKNLCPNCKQPMSYSGVGNQMVCKNEKCRGIKHEQKNTETGEIKVWYSPAFEVLDNKSAEIAYNIFADY